MLEQHWCDQHSERQNKVKTIEYHFYLSVSYLLVTRLKDTTYPDFLCETGKKKLNEEYFVYTKAVSHC